MRGEKRSEPILRRLQFRLRGLMLLILVAAMALGWWGHRREQVRRQRLAMEEIQRLQGELTEAEPFWIDRPLSVETEPLPWWLSLSGERAMHTVTGVSFDLRSYDDGFEEESGITDIDLRLLNDFPDLQRLALPRSHVSDAGMAWIRPLRGLRTLDLSQSRVTDRGLRHLERLDSLEWLNLDGVSLHGQGLAHLANCRRLKDLSLRQTTIDSEHVEHLNGLQTLETLVLESATLDRLHLHSLPELRQLTLSLSADQVDLRLERLPRLEHVAIHFAASGSPQKFHLSDLERLTTLTIHAAGNRPGLSNEEGQFVMRALPAVRKVAISGESLVHRLLPKLAKLRNLRELTITGADSSIGDAAARALAQLPSLRRLHMGRTHLTDEGMRTLAEIPALETLSLQSKAITDKGVLHLAALPQLKKLYLEGVSFQHDAGPTICRLPHLEGLSLGDCQLPALTLTGAAIGAPRAFRRLQALTIAKCTPEKVLVVDLAALDNLSLDVPQARVIRIEQLSRLRRLDVSLAAGQTVEQFTMKNLPRLEWMSIQCGPTGARMPGDAFAHLPEMPRLRNGIIWGLEMPQDARQKLRSWAKGRGISL